MFSITGTINLIRDTFLAFSNSHVTWKIKRMCVLKTNLALKHNYFPPKSLKLALIRCKKVHVRFCPTLLPLERHDSWIIWMSPCWQQQRFYQPMKLTKGDLQKDEVRKSPFPTWTVSRFLFLFVSRINLKFEKLEWMIRSRRWGTRFRERCLRCDPDKVDVDEVQSVSRIWASKICLWWFGFGLEPIFTSVWATSKINTQFESVQKQLKK